MVGKDLFLWLNLEESFQDAFKGSIGMLIFSRVSGISFHGEGDLVKGAKLTTFIKIIKDSLQNLVFGFKDLRRGFQ